MRLLWITQWSPGPSIATRPKSRLLASSPGFYYITTTHEKFQNFKEKNQKVSKSGLVDPKIEKVSKKNSTPFLFRRKILHHFDGSGGGGSKWSSLGRSHPLYEINQNSSAKEITQNPLGLKISWHPDFFWKKTWKQLEELKWLRSIAMHDMIDDSECDRVLIEILFFFVNCDFSRER